MSKNIPRTAAQMRALLAQFLEQSKGTMYTERDRQWAQSEIERYNDQTVLLKQGIKSSVKATGVIRKVDELGRLVIPKEQRNVYGLEPGVPMEFFIDEARGMIVLQKYSPGCGLCGQSSEEDMTMFQGNRVCENCLNELFNMV